MTRVFYLVAPSVEVGVASALGRGWSQVARTRFVTEANEDVRLICRFHDLVPFPGVTPMVRAEGYEDGTGAFSLDRWVEDMGRFDDFVGSGRGEWIDG
jgi:hypothetical protein